jgi:hypothetical protein
MFSEGTLFGSCEESGEAALSLERVFSCVILPVRIPVLGGNIADTSLLRYCSSGSKSHSGLLSNSVPLPSTFRHGCDMVDEASSWRSSKLRTF